MSEPDQTRTEVLQQELDDLLKGRYNTLRNMILDMVNSNSPTTMSKAEALFPQIKRMIASIDEETAKGLGIYIDKAYVRGKLFAAKNLRQQDATINVAFNIRHRKALDEVKRMSLLGIKNINDELRGKIQIELLGSVANGESIGDFRERLERIFDMQARVNPKVRASAIARTEMIRAYNKANVTEMIESGVVKKKKWLAGKGACPSCRKLAGQEQDLDKPFTVKFGGEIKEVMTPPLHPNCRCSTTAIIFSKEELIPYDRSFNNFNYI